MQQTVRHCVRVVVARAPSKLDLPKCMEILFNFEGARGKPLPTYCHVV